MIVAFTGHRPDKFIKNKWDTYDTCGSSVKTEIRKILQKLQQCYPNIEVISGMALGVDMWAAIETLSLKIPLIAAIPFKGQESVWNDRHKNQYNAILEVAKEVIIVTPGGYEVWKMQKRNQYMVDRCDLLIAIWNGDKGGTKNCVDYAIKVNRKIWRLNPDNMEWSKM